MNNPTFRHTGFDGKISSVAVMLVAARGDVIKCIGSGVIIAPGIALTARHVIEGFQQLYGDPFAGSEGTFSLSAYHFFEGAKGYGWSVRKLSMGDPNYADIVFLHLSPTHADQLDQPPKHLTLRVTPPEVGATISAFGYHSPVVRSEGDKLEITTNPYTSTGVVTEVHLVERDRFMLPYPCFATNARFDPAMSGGPVFHDGALVGLISTNLPPGLDDPPDCHTSYVSLLWPMLGISVSFDRPNRTGQTYLAYELATEGFIGVTDLDCVTVQGKEVILEIPKPRRLAIP